MANKKKIKLSGPRPLHPNIGIYNKELGFLDDEDKFHPICHAVYAPTIRKNLETGVEEVLLEYTSGGAQESRWFPREVVAKADISELARYGVEISNSSKYYFGLHMDNQLYQAKRYSSYSHVGWKPVNRKLHYLLADASVTSLSPAASYTGSLNARRCGEEDAWNDMYSRCVAGHTPLELAVVLGASSCLVGYLSGKIGTETLFVNIVGKTSTGKTTMLNLAVSTAGPSVKKEGSLKISWNATGNGITGLLSGNAGVPIAIDELSESASGDLTQLLFQIADGSSKLRAKTDGTPRPADTWHTTVLSTSNVSVYDFTNGNDALQTRVLEFEDVPWTRSAKEAEEINRVTASNAGFLIPKFAGALAKYTRDDLVDRLEEIRGGLPPVENPSGKESRIDLSISLLILTAEILEQDVQLQLNANKIRAFLCAYRKKTYRSKMREEDEAYIRFVDCYYANSQHFASPTVLALSGEVWGRRRQKNGWREVCVYKGKLEEMLTKKQQGKAVQAVNITRILKNWKQRGILSADNDRLTRKVQIGGEKPIMYVIRLVDPDKIQQVTDPKSALTYREIPDKPDQLPFDLDQTTPVEEEASAI